MTLSRRQAFTSLLAVPALLTTGITLSPAPAPRRRPLLDELNQRLWDLGHRDYGHGRVVGDYELWFTGFKPAFDSTVLGSQYLAWPGSWMTIEQRKAIGRYFAVPIGYEYCRQYCREYHPGEVFPCSNRVNLETLITDPDQFVHWADNACKTLEWYITEECCS